MAETVTRRGFLDFSPVKRDDANKENDVPVLVLTLFSKAPFVAFGTVKLGTSKSVILRIENPTEDAEAEVTVEKIPSSKGFSVDHSTFIIQPEDSFTLNVTWTPTEDGGIRELIVFKANGVLKHQAVLLGRAEAPKKKKKSLWDTIKNKRDGGNVIAPRRKKTEPPLKMSANKTFQVSRKPQYRREKPRSPLASLNDGKAARERPLPQQSPADGYPQKPGRQTSSRGPLGSDQENIPHVQKSSPLVQLVPAGKLLDVSASPDALVCRAENKMLNRTLSPIGTPEMFKKLMPRIQTDSPLSAAVKSDGADSGLTGSPVLSLKDALALIDSDLSHVNLSPRDTSSSCGFSDSLESKSCGAKSALADSPQEADANEPRLTFFVSKKVAASEEADGVNERVKKASFTSATVTKSRAPVEPSLSSGRKIKKSRRRLLERTLELSEGSGQCESGPETPSLPVIHPGAQTKGGQVCGDQEPHSSPPPVTFPITSPLSLLPARFSFSATPPLPAAPVFTVTSPSPLSSSSPLHHASPSAEEDLFPVQIALKSKKRKSEEFLKSNAKVEDAGKAEAVKRSRVVPGREEPRRSVQERRSTAQRPQPKTAGSARSMTTSSLKTTRSTVPAQTKQSNTKLASQGVRSLKAAGASTTKTKRVVAVAQSKLSFIRPTQTAIPRHPMPFAAKNMFYDERWIEKQERGFTWWINHVLTPDDFRVNTEVAKMNAVSLAMGSDDKFSVPKAPTKEEMSFSTYTARRKLNRLRRSACQLFTSEPMVKAIQRLELEVEARRLLVRRDRHLWKDIGERRKVLNWLLSYNLLWLRIGLETIFGELISLESNSDAVGLAMFVLQRLLWSPDIAAQFRHAKVPHLYRDGHEEALSRFTLKKLLLLVCFLDRAKESRLIEHDPCLFCLDAEFKTSKDLLLAFSRDFLSGEGILPRHLGLLGLPVSHAQTPLDEFNFAVKNLAVDLRCGIRLVRVMELLVQDWSFSAKLRLPAISRLQKVHNVDVALQLLRSRGVDLKDEHGSVIDARDVVDGHREKTLSLLWKIIFAFQVEVLLDEEQLREEICFLRRTLSTKRRLAALRADRGAPPAAADTRRPFEHSSTRIGLLMDWSRAVCDFYGLKVENFTVAFSDGRVLCLLIRHYHPGLLPGGAVSHSTTQTVECSPRGRLELDCSASDSDASFDSSPTGLNGPDSPSVEFKELLENEKNNFRLVNTAAAFLGGVPAMINPADMSNTIPNEKVVMSYLSFLCARLLDLRNETRAARIIQAAWRKRRLQRNLQLYEERNAAAVKIQSLVRTFLHRRRAQRQNHAAAVIQSAWRGFAARRRLRLQKRAQLRALQQDAATVIQAQWRMFSAVKAFRRLRRCAVVLQAQWRMRRAASAYGRICWAAAVIQTHSRARTAARRERQRYLTLRAAAVTVQRGYRRWKTRKTEKENQAARVIQAAFRKWFEGKVAERAAAAVKIQSWYRGNRCLRQYRRIKRSAVFIQAQVRGHAQRRRFHTLKLRRRSAVVLQSAVRGHAVRKQLAERRRAAVVIQRRFRAARERDAARQKFVRMRRAAVAIQAAYRGKAAREALSKRRRAATVIQAAFRRHAAQRRYLALRRAAGVIQQRFRAAVLAREAKRDYNALRNAALAVQAHWRGRADRRRLEKLHRCATIIQACYRKHKAQAEFRATRACAVALQRRFRAHKAGAETRRLYLHTRAACVTLQAAFRGARVRAELRRSHRAATVIQASVRMFLRRKQYFLLQSAAIIIQSRYRALLLSRAQQREYGALKHAAVRIQAAYRGLRARRELQEKHDAATAIQAQFRMHRARMAYLATKCAAIMIQERYRAKRLRDQQAERYQAMRSAAGVIQAAYRGHRARRQIAHMHRAAAIIQRKFIAVRDRNRFMALRAAASVCQRRFRAATLARKDRLDFLSKRSAAVRLQAVYRGCQVRKRLQEQNRAAVIIQSHFRKHQQRARYKALHRAATLLQARHRANRRMRAEVHNLQTKRSAAVLLQAAFRGMKSRRVLKQKHQAARVLQRAFRAHSERKRFLTLKSSVLIIQRRYRANVAAKEQMQRYQNMCKAAVVLQAAFRGQRVRKEVARRHQAATVIQSAFRKHREEVKFKAMCVAAILIQRFYRSCVLQRTEREKFLRIKRSTITLQAAFRGHRVRSSIAKKHRAATVIQANFRRLKQQAAFRTQRWAACVLQQRFRAQRQRNADVHRYQTCRRAAVLLQAAFRGMKLRQTMKEKHQAARVLQRAFRAHSERKHYLTLKSSALIIQQRYRANVAAKAQRSRYQNMCSAAIMLQAAFRGQRVRKEVARQHQAATVIQSAFRKHREEVKFKAMCVAAILIQRFYRSCVLQRTEREKFIKIRRAAVVLQAAFRGMKLRQIMKEKHQAARVLQRAFRAHSERKRFLTLKSSVLLIQRRYRANVAAKEQMQRYQNMCKAAVVLQAAFRGQRVRSSIAKKHRAATVIQANFRRLKQQAAFRTQRWAACVLQQRFRAQRQRNADVNHYQTCRRAAVLLQAAFRGMKLRQTMKGKHQAARVLQRAFRAHSERKHYLTLKSSALIIQQRYRANVAAKAQRSRYQNMCSAAIRLQAAFRGQRVRKEVARQHQAATVIQSAFRKHREEVKFKAMCVAAILIQRFYRSCVLQRTEREKFIKIRRAAVVLQAAFRGMKLRQIMKEKHQAARVLQRAFRAHSERKRFLTLKSSVLLIQRRYRANVAAKEQMQRYQNMCKAAVVLQAAFRGHRVRSSIAKKHRAATVIQANFRRLKQQAAFRTQRWAACVLQQRFRAQRQRNADVNHYQTCRRAAVLLQAAFRGMKLRQTMKGKHQAARVLQRAFRAHSERKHYLTLKSSALIIQQRYRANVAAKAQRSRYQNMCSAAVVLQAAFRGQRVRKEVARRHQAATVIQSAFRKHREEVKFKAMCVAAILIQRFYRSCVLQRTEREKFLRIKRSTITLQAAFRGWSVRTEINRRHRAAVVVQSCWRCSVQRRSFRRKREAALKIQRRVRAAQLCRLQRNDFTRKRRAAVTLQTHCRAWMARRQLLERAQAERRLRFTAAAFHHLSAVKIQRALRAHWALEAARRQINSVITVQRWVRARQQRRRYLEDRRKVLTAQAAVRRWLARRHAAASVIQHAVRNFLLLRRRERIQQGIVKAQALWRGHRSRRLNDDARLVKLRRRLRDVSAAVRDEDKLCNKTSSALDYLLRYKHFSYILEALRNLETATRLSPECCERLVESGATNVIFTLIRCCNRSVPCMDVITFSVQILLNLSKYHRTVEAVYLVQSSVETLLDLLQRYREKAGDKVAEKGGSIFTKACFLLALLLQDRQRAVEVMKLPKVCDRIRSIYRLTARKNKLDAERSVLKQKMNASINRSFFVPATPRKSRPAPKFAPDWVLRRDRLQDVVDPFRAIQMLAHTLNIGL